MSSRRKEVNRREVREERNSDEERAAGAGYTPTALLSHKYLAFLESLSNIKAVF